MSVDEFHYQVRWRPRRAFAGLHRSAFHGDGYEFRNHIPLLRGGDPRRYDARASLRDPLGQMLVRVHEQRDAIPVVALLDVSASMAFRGRASKRELMADFVDSLGLSAYRTGDSFGAIACDEHLRVDLMQPLSRVKGAGGDVASRIRAAAFDGASAKGLLQAAGVLGRARSLVFLVSDFHLPPALIEATLDGLSRHTVVPIALVDSAEFSPAPGVWMARVADAESGAQRTVMVRPSLRRRLRARFEERQAALAELFNRHGTAPLRVVDTFDADDVTRYFFGG